MTVDAEHGRAASETFKTWLVSSALPLWASVGFDAEKGRFCERLDWDGRPVDCVPHRAMVQARQIYVFAHAAHLGWFAEGSELADMAMVSLLRDYRGTAGFAFSIDRRGEIVSATRDAYAHAFILFALAWLYRVSGDKNLLAVANETIAYIDSDLMDPIHGGLFDEAGKSGGRKRQNPLMHLLEAYLALEQSFPENGFIERAAKLVALFKTRLFDEEHGVLLEYFAEDWAPYPDPSARSIFEPGHHYEWVWLLRQFELLSGQDLRSYSERLFATACAHGIAPNGLVFDELATDRGVVKPSHRVWPHTEAAKAAVVRHALGDAEASRFGAMMVRGLMENFLNRPFAGGWVDHLGPDLRPLVDYVPASSLYHLFLAGAELDRGFAPPP
jgi:mannose/cellobiose epimerase-like protein (N-acyl-D-glucosamine 2-epimerase family)